ncbi:MAG: hypothetical protein V1664_02185 [Candidatus Uhrbacteria bacterium]
MQVFLAGPFSDNAGNLLRRLGYGEHIGHGQQISYSRRLSGADFPRYHVYAEEQPSGIKINLHLDQKPSNLGSGAMHGGEYEGVLVEKEMTRITGMIRSWQPATSESAEPKDDSGGGGFWGKIFG